MTKQEQFEQAHYNAYSYLPGTIPVDDRDWFCCEEKLIPVLSPIDLIGAEALLTPDDLWQDWAYQCRCGAVFAPDDLAEREYLQDFHEHGGISICRLGSKVFLMLGESSGF